MESPDSDMPVYVYCLTQSPIEIHSVGIDGNHTVLCAPVGNLFAVFQHIDVEGWTGDAATKNMNELAWIGPRACHHEEIIERSMDSSPVFPLPFATLFSNLKQCELQLLAQEAQIEAFLHNVSGRREWGVKGVLDRKAAASALLGNQPMDFSGASYLARKRQERDIHLEVEPWLDSVIPPIFEQLAALSADARILTAHNRNATGDVVFHWAFLVEDSLSESFQRAVSTLGMPNRAKGLELLPSGPWPAYSFRPNLDTNHAAE
ncbi:MAG: GvpL/GvpF family gas vesicle protein [bacterium]